MSDRLTVRAAADRLGIGYSTLKQWIYDGEVRTTRTTGGHHRIAESEITRLLLSGDTKSGRSASALRATADRSEAQGGRSTPQGGRSTAHGDRSAAPGVLVALSGRNQLRGVVDEVRSEGLLSQVRLRIGDQILTAVITRDAVTELKLKRGDEAIAIVKATEVMIGRSSIDRRRHEPRRRS